MLGLTETCPICTEERNWKVIATINCAHRACVQCMKRWYHRSTTFNCPFCRTPVTSVKIWTGRRVEGLTLIESLQAEGAQFRKRWDLPSDFQLGSEIIEISSDEEFPVVDSDNEEPTPVWTIA